MTYFKGNYKKIEEKEIVEKIKEVQYLPMGALVF